MAAAGCWQEVSGPECWLWACRCVAVVTAKLGGIVTATDLKGNLPLLTDNCRSNGVPEVHVCEHSWGCADVDDLQPPFDVITACDVMYIDELAPALVKSLVLLSGPDALIHIAHGRNRPAEPAFRKAAAQHFGIELVPSAELDEVYQCSDVNVLRLRRRLDQIQQPQQPQQEQKEDWRQ
eukprot:GHUV01010470.1.p1 GENE.GHUV01010470.1~~GHUV01010470.1.p1  ORF type:complete len:179 (+),score=53.42 GHUV01010470.1:849-1385(+)